MKRKDIWDEIIDERDYQDKKFNRAPHYWPAESEEKLAVLTEEVGEVARAINDEQRKARLKRELVQVAATAVAWLEVL